MILTMISTLLLLLIATASAFLANENIATPYKQSIGDFSISNLGVHAPFQAYPDSTASTFIWFDFVDQDTPSIGLTRCIIQWPVSDTSDKGTFDCANITFAAWIPDASYSGIQNFTLQLSHSYIDDSIGMPPDNIVTKFGALNLTFPRTPKYDCDLDRGYCGSSIGVRFLVPVTEIMS